MVPAGDIRRVLQRQQKSTSKADKLLYEAQKALITGRITGKNVLDNLKFYQTSFEFLDDDEVGEQNIFTPGQIREVCIKLHLRFQPSQAFEGEVPYEAVLKIEELNKKYGKELKHFKIVSTRQFFSDPACHHQALLFAQTLYGNYYLVHSWGHPLGSYRLLKYFVLRNFESLMLVLILFTLAEGLSLPNKLLSTDTRATYFSMYRMAGLFHLLILNLGLTIFILFAFHLNFSENNWDSPVKRKNS